LELPKDFLKTKYKPFQHPEFNVVGLYQNEGPGRHNENYWLYTAMAIHTIKLRFEDPGPLISSIMPFAQACEIEPGLFHRFPGWDSRHMSQDELYGIVSIFRGTQVAKEVLRYAEKNQWCFNNVAPGQFLLKSWLERFLQTRALVKLCAGEKPSPIDLALWSLGMITSCLTHYGESSGKQLSYLNALEFRDYDSVLVRVTIAVYTEIMQRKYPGGPSEMLDVFYHDPDHPTYKHGQKSWVHLLKETKK